MTTGDVRLSSESGGTLMTTKKKILLADEILAVGDLSFQERCLERVKQEAERGLSVLFVSHDMDAIARVCNRVLWLNAGRVAGIGDPEEVVDEYQNSVWARGLHASERGRHANRFAAIHDLKVVTADGWEVRGLLTDQQLFLRMRFETLQPGIRARARTNIGIGVTGIAGPEGGTPAKPVGTVCIGTVVSLHGGDAEASWARTFPFFGGREMVIFQSTQAAMNMLRLMLIGRAPLNQ